MSITAMKQAVQALIDIEIATDLKRLYRYDDEKRMDMVVEEAITALRTAIAEAEACEPVAYLAWRDGKPKKYNVIFKCEFEGHISDDLKYDLDNGKIQSIELITEKEKYTNIDEDGYIQEKCKTLVLTLKDEDKPIKDKFNRMKKVFSSKKEDYSRARIKFKTPTGVDRTVEMDTDAASAQGYVKKEKLDGFEFDLKSSYDKFCDPILGKMKELLMPEA